jgi:hypothetical protein
MYTILSRNTKEIILYNTTVNRFSNLSIRNLVKPVPGYGMNPPVEYQCKQISINEQNVANLVNQYQMSHSVRIKPKSTGSQTCINKEKVVRPGIRYGTDRPVVGQS